MNIAVCELCEVVLKLFDDPRNTCYRCGAPRHLLHRKLFEILFARQACGRRTQALTSVQGVSQGEESGADNKAGAIE